MKKILAISVLLINLPIIIFFWLKSSGELLTSGQLESVLIALGRIAGLFGVYFVLLQLILIGRVKWLEKLFGLDKLSVVHHWNGLLALLFIILHPVLLVLSYARLNQLPFLEQFGQAVTSSDDLFSAFLAFLLFLLLVILSLIIVRRRLKYETWYFSHLFTYVAILLAFGHQLELGADLQNNLFAVYWYLLYFLAFGHLLFYRFGQPLYNFYQQRFYIAEINQENAQALSIIIKGRNLANFKVRAGQFFVVRFLNRQLWWQAHPFSISCCPKGESLRLTIKPLGDFTRSLRSNLKAGDYILLDGPNGIFTLNYAKKNKLLLIAGGVGITPLRGMVEEALEKYQDVVLLYANRRARDIIFKTELDELAQKFPLKLHYLITDDPTWPGESGHLTQEKLNRLVPDLAAREVYLCGPSLMMKSVRKILQSLGLAKTLIHFEKFSLS